MGFFDRLLRAAPLDRRAFLRHSGLIGAAAAVLPDRVVAAPYEPYRLPAAAGRPVRVRGVVRSAGRGLAGVPVTDGLRMVDTGPDGSFDMVSSSEREFVYLSLPAGHGFPTNPTGTARFYEPLRPDGRDEMDVVFDLEPLDVSDERHTLLLLADIQTQDAQDVERFFRETLPDLEDTLAAMPDEPVFAVACGDIVFGTLSLFSEYERAVARLGIPCLQVVGNHDLDWGGATDESSTRSFRRFFGPRYYSFDRGAVHYVVLDDVFWYTTGYLGYLDGEQLAWLEQDLARVEAGRPVVVFLHIPVEGTRAFREGAGSPTLGGSVANRQFLYRLLEPYAAHCLAGHIHESEHLFLHGTHGHVSGTVCGAWWTGAVCSDGTPSGYAVYEVRGEEIRWRYKATGAPPDHQIQVYPRGADPTAPDEILANVWDWDPAWSVVLHEGGDRRGSMASRVSLDPLARELYQGPEVPQKHPWVYPYPTRHLFFAPVPEPRGEAHVEVVDRFGRTYSAPVPAS